MIIRQVTRLKHSLKELLKGLLQLWGDLYYTFYYINLSPKMKMANLDYNQYWFQRGLHSLQPRYRIIAKTIEPGSTVLDIGCGEGLLLQYLSETKAVKGYGLDISYEAAKLAQTRGITVEVADILTWEVDKDYDYIILSEVIEHLATPEQIMIKLREHFRKVIIVSIPNIGYYHHRLRLLFGRFPIQWNWHPSEHLRFWTVVDFKEWVRELGLEIVSIQASNGLPFLHKYLPNLFGNQIVFIMRSVDDNTPGNEKEKI